MLRNIEAERARAGLSKEKLATILGISTGTYYNWVNEATDIPSSKLIAMANLFNTDVGYLLEGSEGKAMQADKVS